MKNNWLVTSVEILEKESVGKLFDLGGNSKNIWGQIRKIFVAFTCFYKANIHRKSEVYVFYTALVNINFF